MGREVRRVALEFDWPLGELWDGFLMPKRLQGRQCETCDGDGYSEAARVLRDRWYGHVPFDPSETGSEPFTVETPEVRAFAERNVGHSPDYYGTGEDAIVREARRLISLWNKAWSHHLAQEDVDALIAADRLRDFTHTWDKERRWQPIEPAPEVTAAQVNHWSLRGMAHDSLNCSYVIQAKCERDGLPYLCATCEGHGGVERWPGQRAEADAWEPTDPPSGEGWQLWNTTTEGHPMTPVFATPEELADYCADQRVSWFGHDPAPREKWLATFIGKEFVHVEIAPGVVIM